MNNNGKPVSTGRTWLENHVFDRIAEIGGKAFAVYGILARHANATGTSFPGMKLIAKKVGISERQAKREINKLVKADLISKALRSHGRGAGVHNVYVLKLQGDTPVPLNNTRGQGASIQGDTGVPRST